MIEYAFLKDHVSGGSLVVLTLSLAVFAVHVPMLMGFTVARYADIEPRVATRSARVPLRSRGQQRQPLVPGEPPALRRVSGRAGPRARGQAQRSRAAPASSAPTTTSGSARGRRSRRTSASRSATAAPAATTSTCRSTACSSPPACTNPASDQLERFRAAIDDDRGHAVSSAARAARRGGLTPGEPELKRAPRGYPMGHPRIDRLRMRQLTVSCRHPLEPWLHDPRATNASDRRSIAARPMVKWLAETVGPSTRAPDG